MANKFVIEFSRAPGDVLMLTALIRDLKLTYGDQYLVDVIAPFPDLWRHNPYLTKLDRAARDVKYIDFSRGDNSPDRVLHTMSKAGHRVHYVQAFHRSFEQRTGIHVPLLFPHGDLHLSEDELERPYVDGRYWIVVPGGKTDMTNKWWLDARWQEVVDKLRPWGIRFVQEGCTKKLHVHKPLNNVFNCIGYTTIRDMMVNIHHSDGVICGCTLQHHLAAALGKPCVMLLGGREEPWYEAYCDDYKAFAHGNKCRPVSVPHRVLHTFGMLSCCSQRGCWRRRVVPLDDKREKYNKSPCERAMVTLEQVVPECMHMITVDHVVEAVMSYYTDRTIPVLPHWNL